MASPAQQPQGPQGLSKLNLTMERLPDLVVNRYRTDHASRRETHYKNDLEPWGDFEQSVRRNLNLYRARITTFDNNIVTYRSYNDPLHHEQYSCGNEIGVVGRIGQNVGQVMTVVSQRPHQDLRFGDWRNDRQGINDFMPDLAILEGGSAPRIVGEAKTPWTVDLSTLVHHQELGGHFRQYIGQLARYMAAFDLNYGFLTTYNETLFFKRGITTYGTHFLMMSNVIKHSTASQLVQQSTDLRGKVSLRECMLYFFFLAAAGEDEWKCDSRRSIKPREWVSRDAPNPEYSPEHPMPRRSGKGGSGFLGGPGPSSGGGQGRSHGKGPESNTQLSIENPCADLRVKWGEQKQSYCYEKEPGVRGWVEDYKMDKNQLLVKVNGMRRRAVTPDGKYPHLALAGGSRPQMMAVRLK